MAKDSLKQAFNQIGASGDIHDVQLMVRDPIIRLGSIQEELRQTQRHSESL